MRKGQLKMRGRCGLVLFLVLLACGFLVTYYIWNRTWLSSAPSRKATNRHSLSDKYEAALRQHGVLAPPQTQQQRGQQLPQSSQNSRPVQPPRGLSPKDTQLAPPQKSPNLPGDRRVDQDDYDDDMDEEIEKISKEEQGEGEGMEGKDKTQPSQQDLLYMEPDETLAKKFHDMQRLVHLDLKGAPPSIEYLEVVMPILKQAGATGLLVEYEDSFPYVGNLSLLAADTAYTQNQILKLVKLAEQQELDIIPLVPTFGHMEFILKHPEFAELRETATTPQVISPVKNRTYALIKSIISQVLAAHPKARYIHIGHDEVYELGKGQSDGLMAKFKLTKDEIFVMHTKKVVGLIKDSFPQLKVLMWDDHFRAMPLEKMMNAQLSGMVELMVWNYETDVNVKVPPSVWKKYGKVFPNVWVASAFKGATGVTQYITNASHHLQNHYSWISTIRDHQKEVSIKGMAITGWSRYDYFSTLTELLPAALPSLTACLLAAKNAGFTQEQHALASKFLSCHKNVELDMPRVVNGSAVVTQDCAFPGSPIFYGTQQLWGIVNGYESDRGLQERIKGWLTDYHIRHGFSSPGQLKVLNGKLSKAIDALSSLRGPMEDALKKFFDKSTVEEWLDLNFDQRLSHLKSDLNKSAALASQSTWGKRPGLAGSPTAATGGNSQGMVPQSQGMPGNQGNGPFQQRPRIPGGIRTMDGSPYNRPQPNPKSRDGLPQGGAPSSSRQGNDAHLKIQNGFGGGGQPPLLPLSQNLVPSRSDAWRQSMMQRQDRPGGSTGQGQEQGGPGRLQVQARLPSISNRNDDAGDEKDRGRMDKLYDQSRRLDVEVRARGARDDIMANGAASNNKAEGAGSAGRVRGTEIGGRPGRADEDRKVGDGNPPRPNASLNRPPQGNDGLYQDRGWAKQLLDKMNAPKPQTGEERPSDKLKDLGRIMPKRD